MIYLFFGSTLAFKTKYYIQLAKALGKTHEEAMKLLSMMGVDVIDYDFEDDMKFMDSFLSKY